MSDKPFIWFEDGSVEKLRSKLNAAGDGARLEIHPVGDSVIDGSFHLVVVAKDGHGHDPINDSHICPPVCP